MGPNPTTAYRTCATVHLVRETLTARLLALHTEPHLVQQAAGRSRLRRNWQSLLPQIERGRRVACRDADTYDMTRLDASAIALLLTSLPIACTQKQPPPPRYLHEGQIAG